MRKNIIRGICLVMAEAVLLTGCSSKPSTVKTENTTKKEANVQVMSANQSSLTLDSLREKYGETTADYAKDSIQVERNQNIEYSLGYNPYKKDDVSLYDSFTIYQDADLKYKVTGCSYDYDATTGKLIITPPTFGYAEPTTRYGSEITLSDLTGSYLYDDTTKDNWGNFKQLYLVQNCDEKTGEPLSKPMIHIIKIKSELSQAPVVTYSSNENGEAYISWEPVEGAKEYLLFTVLKIESGIDNYSYVFGRTSETSWTAPNMDGDDGTTYIMNEMFRNFITSEDDEYGGMEDMNGDLFDTMQANIGVIAITDNGASPISDLYPVKEYAKLLPNCMADHASEDQDANSLFRESIATMPAEASVTMCDGSTAPRVLEYDFEHTTLDTDSLTPRLDITANISGTKFHNDYTVVVEDLDSLDAQLQALKERQEGLENRAGTVKKKVTVEDDSSETPSVTPEESTTPEETMQPEETVQPEDPVQTQEPEQTEEPEQTNPGTDTLEGNTDLKVTANSALSEYVARAMLISATDIDISAFTESQNTDIVVDAVLEAQYQNPLVMGIEDITYDGANHILHVSYTDSTTELEEKRQSIITKSKELVSTIIKDGMSDLEKEMAINEYLCETGTYDDAALENAKQYDYKKVDSEFDDSFTPYGILINGVGVCASYAGSFKVLADEANLDCIVVTGNLNGNLSHAWNRVKVDNEWRTVDSTNNDNDVIKNALFNVPDSGITGVLTSNEQYVMDDQLNNYTCKSDEDEYYHYNSKFFTKDAIADQFVSLLNQEDQSVLRTDYTITDEDFSTIAKSVAQTMQQDLKGYYWLGVIHLSK